MQTLIRRFERAQSDAEMGAALDDLLRAEVSALSAQAGGGFRPSEDAHCLYLTCARCGEQLVFTRSARPEEIERAKQEHECRKANGAAVGHLASVAA